MEDRLTAFTKNLIAAKHIGLDTMCFIYQFSQDPRFGPLTYRLFELISQKKITTTTSMVSVVETFVRAEKHKNADSIRAYEKIFLNLPGLTIVPIDWTISRITAKLRARYPTIRLPDAMQIAASLLSKCSLFLTNDEQLRQVKEIEVKILKDYLT